MVLFLLGIWWLLSGEWTLCAGSLISQDVRVPAHRAVVCLLEVSQSS
jgi:hypothetical protein